MQLINKKVLYLLFPYNFRQYLRKIFDYVMFQLIQPNSIADLFLKI